MKNRRSGVFIIAFLLLFVLSGCQPHQHSFSEWVTTRAATCTSPGIQTGICSCGSEEIISVPPTGHQWKDASCTIPKHCTICAKREGSALGHISDGGNICSRCGNKIDETIVLPLEGKTILNFGDSIFGNARPPKDVSTFLATATGATVHNVAFGGCRMGKHIGNWDAFSMYRLADAIASGDWSMQDNALNYTDRTSYAETPLALLKSLDFNNVDVITIAYGTNDFTGENRLDDAANKYNTKTFAGALRYSIEKIQSAYPNIQIILCTPTYRFWMDADGNFLYDSDTYEKVGYKLTDFVQKTKDVAKEYGLTVIDNYYGCGIDSSNKDVCFPSNDGTHPNQTGRELIAKYMANALIVFFEKQAQ